MNLRCRQNPVLLVKVQDAVSVKDEWSVGFTHGQTGRYALHSDSAHPTDTLRIDDLVRKAADGHPDELRVYADGLVAQFKSAAVIEHFAEARLLSGSPGGARPIFTR